MARKPAPKKQVALSKEDALAIVASELDYISVLRRNTIKKKTPIEHLAIIEQLCAKMKESFYNDPGYPSANFMRKIAAVAVNDIMQNGGSSRSNLDVMQEQVKTDYENIRLSEFGRK